MTRIIRPHLGLLDQSARFTELTGDIRKRTQSALDAIAVEVEDGATTIAERAALPMNIGGTLARPEHPYSVTLVGPTEPRTARRYRIVRGAVRTSTVRRAVVPVTTLAARFGRGRFDALMVEQSHGDDGRPDAWPTRHAGFCPGIAAFVPQYPTTVDKAGKVRRVRGAAPVMVLNMEGFAEMAADLDRWETAHAADEAGRGWSPISSTADVPALWAQCERERWDGARGNERDNLAAAVPVTRRKVNRGGVETAVVHTGRALMPNGETVDLEHAADDWLRMAGYEADRPDVVSESVDPFTLLDRYDDRVRPDRVAWRGAAHYRPVTNRRDSATNGPNGQAATVALTSRRYWADVEYVAPMLDKPSSWRLTACDLPATQRETQAESTQARKTRVRSAIDDSVKMGASATDTPATAIGALSGPSTTVWQASRATLYRHIRRSGEALAARAERLAEMLADGADVAVNDALTVRAVRGAVDDGVHGPEAARLWAMRATLAGVFTG